MKVDTPDEPLARIFDAAGCIMVRADRHRQTTRDLCTRAAK